jgi:hypothetical protein
MVRLAANGIINFLKQIKSAVRFRLTILTGWHLPLPPDQPATCNSIAS